jgi:3-dehydroquinate synthase
MRPEIINIDGSPLYLDKDFNYFKSFISSRIYSSYVVLGDENSIRYCYPVIQGFLPDNTLVVEVAAGEANKTIETCHTIWQKLLAERVDRRALALLLGGGVIGDMGGLAVSTYKRGMDFVHIPTTLMSMTDSSIGGKTGIDFEGVKNAIGLFSKPKAIFTHLGFLDTLPDREVWSGFSEIVKHALIADQVLFRSISKTLSQSRPDINYEILRQSILVKKTLVERDPFESSVRKALNFGHTIGHAIESCMIHATNPITHGEAVLYGMIAEAWLSHRMGLILADNFEEILSVLLRMCDLSKIKDIDRQAFFNFILNDKKNESGKILFSLLNGIGSFSINKSVDKDAIDQSIDYLLAL